MSLPAPVDPLSSFSAEYLSRTRAPGLVAANVCCQLLSTIVVVARFYTKAWLLRSWKLDDTILVVAWLLATASSAVVYYMVSLGAGKHIQAVPPQNIALIGQAGYIAQLLFIAVLPFTKLVVCVAYRRVFVFTARYVLDIIMGILVLTMVPLFFISVFQCRPISAFWTATTTFEERMQKCTAIDPAFYANGASNILTDVALIVVAFVQIRKLQMPRRQQIALLCVVSLGWLAAVASIARLALVLSTKDKLDVPWDSYKSGVWTAVEINVGLICVAAPTLKPLISRWRPHLLGMGSWVGARGSTQRTGDQSARFSRLTGPNVLKEVDVESESVMQLTSVGKMDKGIEPGNMN